MLFFPFWLAIDSFAMNGEDSADEWADWSSLGEEGNDRRWSLVEMGVDDSNFLLEDGLGVEKSFEEEGIK